jgi:hypothetical protein
MPESTLHLSFSDQLALEREYAANLVHGRAFVPGASGLELFGACSLVLRHPSGPWELGISCQVVMVSQAAPLCGIALQFLDRSAPAMERLADFVARGAVSPSPEPPAEASPARSPEDAPARDDPDADAGEEGADLDLRGLAHEQEEAEDEGPVRSAAQRTRGERLRERAPAARQRVAQGGVLEDRVMLERMYGSAVWELLLRNPKITVPEVASMARKGTLPRPLLELIADNENWIRQPSIRRALLGNPRLATESAQKVLRCLPPRELKLVPQQTAYPAAVRQAAQRMLRGSG